MNTEHEQHGRIPDDCSGLRLDQALGRIFPDYSRARLQKWIRQGLVLVDGEQWRPRDPVRGGEQVRLTAQLEEDSHWQAEAMPLNIIFQDDDLLVIDKPAGLVVHPAVGNRHGTLVNALLHHVPELARLPRAGVVHRIDKDTSGLLVVARSLRAHTHLVRQLKEHAVEREYLAIAGGTITAGGCVDAPIGRHPRQRTRMAVVDSGRPARTHYRVLEHLPNHSYLSVRLETGRTHQIRVHMAHIRHPLLGDPVYGGRPRPPKGLADPALETLHAFRRQALHAARLELNHPGRDERLAWESPLPDDMQAILGVLRTVT